MSSTVRDIRLDMTAAEAAEIDEQLRDSTKLTVGEYLTMIRSRPGHRPYSGPPVAEAVREGRAEREAQLDKHFGL